MNNPHYINFKKLIEKLGHRYGTWEVFIDFLEMAAISFSNAVDHSKQRQVREDQYLQTVKRYDKSDLDLFPKMFAELTMAMEVEPGDILGRLFGELGLGNKWAGQFFTPDHVARMMGQIAVFDKKQLIEDKGFIKTGEPAIGSGVMVINFALAMLDEKINPQQTLLVTGVDIDIKCIYMAYIQLTLLHIPATLIHGNTITGEVFSTWYTPAYIMDGWAFRRQRETETEKTGDSLDNIVELPKPEDKNTKSEQVQPNKYELMSLFG